MKISKFYFEFDNEEFLSSSLMLMKNSNVNVNEANQYIVRHLIGNIRMDFKDETICKKTAKKSFKKFIKSLYKVK